MTHYDVLGVRRDANETEIRQAYLAAARRSHPDVSTDDDPSTMRDVNAAWKVLSDPARRAQYDLTLEVGSHDSGGDLRTAEVAESQPTGMRMQRPAETPFVPYYEFDEDDDDTWRYTDDEVDPETAPKGWQQLAPMALVVVGFAMAVLGAFVRLVPLAAFGAAIAAIGFAAFVIVPLAVMAKASSVERQRSATRNHRPRTN